MAVEREEDRVVSDQLPLAVGEARLTAAGGPRVERGTFRAEGRRRGGKERTGVNRGVKRRDEQLAGRGSSAGP